MTDDCAMAIALARHLNAAGGGWTAEYAGLDEVNFTNANGDKFIIHVERVEEFETVWALDAA
ncbi:MAG: hypothetical protein J0I28_07355 [Caulobacterales bacterium]|nr:hypothetical protein [Caulobacterales bacterium]